MDMLIMVKQSSLLYSFLSYKEIEVL
jgi:hypothetical protein